MSSLPTANRKVVLGLGNLLNRDEGLGVEALRLLETRLQDHPGVELLDGGVLGLNLLMIVEECSHLLLLDAVNGGKPAGTIIELDKEDIPLYSGIKLSQHQITFQEVLGLANVRGYLPENIYLIGVQPEDLSIGLGMSEPVLTSLPIVVHKAVDKLVKWGLISSEGERT
jgi:hydrogenase maturation protease